MSSTKQMGLSSFTPQRPLEKPLPERIIDFLQSQDGHKWQGTAHDLCQALNTCLNSPRALAVNLKKATDELKRAGVRITYKKLHGSHVILLSLAHSVAPAITEPSNRSETIGCSKIVAETAPISFPFVWPYATVAELTKGEKSERNRWHQHSGKRYQKPCGLCGGRGVIEFVKDCPGYHPIFLCRSCAEDYVRKAQMIKLTF